MSEWRNVGTDNLALSINRQSYRIAPREILTVGDEWDYALEGWAAQGVSLEKIEGDGWDYPIIALGLETTLEELAESNPLDAEEILAPKKRKRKAC